MSRTGASITALVALAVAALIVAGGAQTGSAPDTIYVNSKQTPGAAGAR